jgi:hypothetical protein
MNKVKIDVNNPNKNGNNKDTIIDNTDCGTKITNTIDTIVIGIVNINVENNNFALIYFLKSIGIDLSMKNDSPSNDIATDEGGTIAENIEIKTGTTNAKLYILV